MWVLILFVSLNREPQFMHLKMANNFSSLLEFMAELENRYAIHSGYYFGLF